MLMRKGIHHSQSYFEHHSRMYSYSDIRPHTLSDRRSQLNSYSYLSLPRHTFDYYHSEFAWHTHSHTYHWYSVSLLFYTFHYFSFGHYHYLHRVFCVFHICLFSLTQNCFVFTTLLFHFSWLSCLFSLLFVFAHIFNHHSHYYYQPQPHYYSHQFPCHSNSYFEYRHHGTHRYNFHFSSGCCPPSHLSVASVFETIFISTLIPLWFLF